MSTFFLDKPSSLHVFVPILLSVVFSFVVGVGFAIGLWPVSILLGGLPVIVLLLLFFVNKAETPSSDLLLWYFLVLACVSLIVQSMLGKKLGFLVEVSLLVLSPLLSYRLISEATKSKFIAYYLFGVLFFLLFSVIESLFGRSKILALAFQFITNIKIFLILGLGLYIGWCGSTQRWFWIFIKWFSLILLIHILWQIIHQSSFFFVYKYAYTVSDKFGIFSKRAVGIFPHYSLMGIYSGLLTLFSLSRAVYIDKSYYWVSFVYFVCLLASLERSEIVLTVALSGVLVVLAKGGIKALIRLIVVTVSIAIVSVLLYSFVSEHVDKEARKWGFVGHQKITQPRQVMYKDSIYLANKNFPIGTGLGTFGSSGAQKFDWSLYYDLGYGSYGWIGAERNVLMDTYWPNFIAELGWFGFLMMLGLIVALVYKSFVMWIRIGSLEGRHMWSLPFLTLSFLLFNSLTSNSFQDPAVALLPIVFFGVALRKNIANSFK